jgi:hypothetical protein
MRRRGSDVTRLLRSVDTRLRMRDYRERGGHMGWRGALRTINAEVRRQERAALRRQREAERAWREAAKHHALEVAALEVQMFEAQLEALTSVHRECAETIDWNAVAARTAPSEPQPDAVDRSRSTYARRSLEAYAPTFFERLFGLRGRLRGLENELAEALQWEEETGQRLSAQHEQRLAEWRAATQAWSDTCELARRVLAGDVEAYREVIMAMQCLRELGSVIGDQSVRMTMSSTRAEVTIQVREGDVVPAEQKALTARGKVSTKKFPEAKRMEVYEDYVCGAALRIARELIAVTPLASVLVHVDAQLLNTASGHFEPSTIVSVLCPREKLESVDWDRVDASDLVGSLLHRMKMKRGKGFSAVERLATPAAT